MRTIILAGQTCFFQKTDFQNQFFSQRAKKNKEQKDVIFHLKKVLIKYKGSNLFLSKNKLMGKL
jgi:hypothetical protein